MKPVPATACMPYPARLSGTDAGLGGCLCRVRAGRSRTERVGVGCGCQAGARSWAFGTLMVPGHEASLRVRPPDRCRSLAVEDQRQGWRLRHRVSDASVASALEGDLARRQDARREEDGPAPASARPPGYRHHQRKRSLVCKVRLRCRKLSVSWVTPVGSICAEPVLSGVAAVRDEWSGWPARRRAADRLYAISSLLV